MTEEQLNKKIFSISSKLDSFLPSQKGNAGKILSTNGSKTTWVEQSATGNTVTAETIRDTIADALRGGSLITITPNDVADTITISTTATQNISDSASAALMSSKDTALLSSSGFNSAVDGRIPISTISQHTSAIGTLSSLTTTDKSSLVSAINEVRTSSTPADGSITNLKLATDIKVGSLASLTTTLKSSLVGAINELQSTKSSTSHTHTLTDITNVVLTSPSSGQVLKFNGTNWVNGVDNVGSGSGGGDMFAATYDTTGNGVVDNSEKLNNQLASFYLNTDNHVSGTTNKVYTATEKTKLAAISGTNTGDETLSSIQTKLVSTDNLSVGSTNKYWTNPLTIAAVLTSYVKSSTNRAVAPTDSILTSVGILEKKADDNTSSIGTLSSLTTTAKNTIVAALNEVKATADAAGGGSVPADGSITNAKLANIATATFKGRSTTGTGSPEDLTVSQVKTLLSINNIDNTSDVNKPVSTAQAAADALKVTANSSIAGATKAKITYDSKGLVTAGADLTASDIPTLTASKISDFNTAVDARIPELPSIVDESFETLTYNPTLSVAYNEVRPNKQIVLTGNIVITNTGTSNGSTGLYLFTNDSTPRTVSINGTSITINPTASSKTIVQWAYDGTSYNFDTNYSLTQSIVKAVTSEVNTGTDDAKFITSLGLENSKYLTQSGSKVSATASGTDTYTATITPAITNYSSGQRFFITFTNANTGAVTINLNSLGAKSIKKGVNTNLVSGDIAAGQVFLIAYDGTNFQLIGSPNSSSIPTSLQNGAGYFNYIASNAAWLTNNPSAYDSSGSPIWANEFTVVSFWGNNSASFDKKVSISTSNISLANDISLRWADGTINGGTPDTAIKRNTAGVLEINNTSTGNYRDLKCRSVLFNPPSSITPGVNGELVIEATSNTSITIKLKGSDGIVRSVSLTLS